MIDSLLRIVAPHSCCGCGKIGDILCEQCKYDIVSEPYALCAVCGRPSYDTNLCSACSVSFAIDDIWCVGERTETLKYLIDHYKFSASREGAGICAELLDERLPIFPADIYVVPVPTSFHNVRVRGFDHADMIARRFAERRGYVRQRLLSKVGASTQHFKSRADRLKMTPDDFLCQPVGASVLLIDDIYTTGATVLSCASSLRQAGAEHVYVAIIARQPLDD